MSEDEIAATLRAALSGIELPAILWKVLANRAEGHRGEASASSVTYYGAGCRDAAAARMAKVLSSLFPTAEVRVESDMLCAARAVCHDEEGIACILGTGANSCLFDGQKIVRNISPLGYILGDEGSGAVLGRRLVTDVLKEQLPESLCREFFAAYPDVDAATVVERVYRQPAPNRYLAHFVPFLKAHTDEPAVAALLHDEFSRFFQRNIAPYRRPDLPIHFVGSVAYYFSAELRLAATAAGFTVGRIVKSPLEELAWL